jgi:hypothetical protein
MNAAVQQLLQSFDALPAVDKHQAVVEILRRESAIFAVDIPEAGLVDTADQLFLALDAEEAAQAAR